MISFFPRMAVVLVLLCGCVHVATAEMVERSGRFGGLEVTYKVVLPPGYEASETYPVVLVFTGGSQQLAGAERTLGADWQAEADFWQKYKTPVRAIGQRVNDAYLKSQGQTEGIRTYGMMVDLLIADHRRKKGSELH